MGSSYKGKYTPQNPDKYKGNPSMCIFRSLWERKFMIFCDTNPSVVEWSSEEVVIPYVSPIDGCFHRYFVDFWMKVRTKDDTIREYLIEVKPKSQTKKPVMPSTKKVSKSKINEVRNWMVNSAKWEAARKVCEDKGWEFKILTEDNLFGT